MKVRNRLLSIIAELFLILALIVALFFVFQLIPKANIVQKENNAPLLEYPPPATNLPRYDSTDTPYPPPGTEEASSPEHPSQCQFGPGPTLEVGETSLEDYTFSEPQIVLTSTSGINLVEWLPDSQKILITNEIPGQNQQTIELFNPQSRERQSYAIRQRIDEPPAWFSELNAVIYPVMNILSIDETNHRYEFTRQLWISQGNPENAQLIADNLSNFYVAVKPGDNQMTYLSGGQLVLRNASLEVAQEVDFDSTHWEYLSDRYPPAVYEIAWRPGSSQVVLYSNGDSGGYTFLLDTSTGLVCELDLGGWALVARWSPDGRYLAVARSQGTLPIDFSDLVVLDTVSGKLYAMKITPEMDGRHYVNNIAWSPDSRFLAAIGLVLPYAQSGSGGSEDEHRALYLVDFILGQTRQIISAYKFTGGFGKGLIWAPNGSQLIAACHTGEEGRLCLIFVQESGRP
jgi:Tol biopolymer transport system component